IVLSKLPVDIEVDRLLTWKEMMQGPSRIERAFELAGGKTLPLVAPWLAEKMADLFDSQRTAERELTKFQNATSPYNILHGKMAVLNLASFGVEKQSRHSRALVRADLSEAAARASLAA